MIIRKSIKLTILMLFIASNILSQDNIESNLDKYVEEILKENNIPGLAIAVIDKDSVIICKGYGVRHIDSNEPVDENSLFQIASLSKPFTATLFGMLRDQDIISWDDKIIKHIPDLSFSDTCVTEMATISDLLSIRLGIQGTDNIMASSRESFISLLKNYPIGSAFRTKQSSFNTHYTIAGYLVERIEKKYWDSLVFEKLLDPLEMVSTYTSVEKAQKSSNNIAFPHNQNNEEIKPIEWTDVKIFSPAGGLISNVFDLSKFLRLYLNSGTIDSQTYLSKTTVQQILNPGMMVGNSFRILFNPNCRIMAFGFGWFLSDYKGNFIAEMEGSLPGTSSLIAMAPDKQIGVVLLANKHFCFDSLVKIKYHVFDYYMANWLIFPSP